MNLVKYKPFDSFLSLDRTFNNLLKQSMLERDWFSKESWIPETDLIETDTEVKLQMECPGISPENLKVTYENNMLTVSGEKKNETELKEGSYHKLERSYGSFSRSFSLPTGIDENSITAEYNNGIVSVVATKSEESKAKTIQIKTSENSKPKALSASG